MEINEIKHKWEKEFKKGYSKPFVLFTLAKGPHYPYQIIRKISEQTQGKFAIAGSNIYPLLKNLEDEGLIEYNINESDQKKYFSLTDKGKELLLTLKTTIKDFNEVIKIMMTKIGD